jgi:hypothetical protein
LRTSNASSHSSRRACSFGSIRTELLPSPGPAPPCITRCFPSWQDCLPPLISRGSLFRRHPGCFSCSGGNDVEIFIPYDCCRSPHFSLASSPANPSSRLISGTKRRPRRMVYHRARCMQSFRIAAVFSGSVTQRCSPSHSSYVEYGNPVTLQEIF